MNLPNLKAIRDLALRWAESSGKNPEAWAELEELTENDPARAFRTIEEIHYLLTSIEPRDVSAWGRLAAGPLEMLLVRHGAEVVGAAEQLASSDAEFRKLLCGVWKSDMDEEVHARVQRISDPTYKFI
jgi:hypothetical protein